VNGELLAAMALASHGSLWLHHGKGTPPPELELASPLFQLVRSVTFHGAVEIAGVGPWLADLRARRVDRLWLVAPESERGDALPEHVAVAFAGGGSWLLLATGPARAEAWVPAWDVGDPDAPDGRIWDVTCVGTPVDPGPAQVPESSLADTEAHLVAALMAIASFARRHDLGHWTELFESALDADGEVATGELPAAWPYEARRLAAMASSAWAFGGMGSWNDLGFATAEADDEYEAVSRQLYEAIMRTVVAAVNAPLP
jgi:hypothetical protein